MIFSFYFDVSHGKSIPVFIFFYSRKKKNSGGLRWPRKVGQPPHTERARWSPQLFRHGVSYVRTALDHPKMAFFFFVSSFSFIFSSSVGYNYCRSTSRTNTRNKNNETLYFFFFFQRHSVAGPIKVKSRTPTLVCVHFFFEKKKMWKSKWVKCCGAPYIFEIEVVIIYGRMDGSISPSCWPKH